MGDVTLSCPVPLGRHTTVQLAHGGGGRLMRELVQGLFVPAFGYAGSAGAHDSAVLALGGSRVAFTTDGYVVSPRVFPGGSLGALAVHGTVNDLAMAGATPRWLSAGFIIEEGLPIEELRAVAAEMRRAADACGVSICTGDTKVVDRGKADGLFVTTAGVGYVPPGVIVHPRRVAPGDAVLVSGDVGRHGVAVLSVREGLAFETTIESDCGPLHRLVQALLEAPVDVHCLRDATRGGLATALAEIAVDARVRIDLDEDAIPVADGVANACEVLGLDPLYVACEGRMVAFVRGDQADAALAALRARPEGAGAACIGSVVDRSHGVVTLRTRMGTRRLLDLLTGEQLPRIC